MKIYPFTILTASLCVANNPFMCVAQDVPSGFATDDTPSTTPVEDVGSSESLLDSSSSTVSYTSTPVPGVADSSGSSAVTGEVEALASYGGDDPNFVLPNQPVESVLGFSKTPLETPRSISVISSELISSLSLNDVQDLTKVAPNTFTTTRWGVQGNIDIRNTTADTYFRGMKRIEPQGNSRTTLGSNDQIEIVRGAPAPYLGPGKIGGYSNLTPKSGRSKQGKYLETPTGFFQAVYGSFDRQEVSFGYGGPMKLLGDDLKGGFYVYGLLDDSETYYQHIPSNQKILQAAVSQDLPNGWRLETGFNLQRTQTAGGFLNRVNQELVSNQLYWSGQRLVNLDTDNSGKISQRELELNSPTLNRRLSAANRPLHQRWDSRYMSVLDGTAPDVDMANAPVNSALAAIMKTSLAPMIDQKTANLLALLPQGFPLDPATVKKVKADFTAVALERELQADLGLFYLDMIKDDFDDLKLKNQLFFDMQDQFKDSELNYYQKQDVYVMEEKFTVEKTFSDTPEWLDNLALIFSPNVRHTNAQIQNNTGDYDDSPDLGLPGNVRTPNDLFLSPRENDDYFNEGAFYTDYRRSTYTEFGVGALIDATFLEKANLTTGARVDYIDARTTDLAGVYSVTSGTVDDPLARRRNQDLKAQGGDLGLSYSASFSYELPKKHTPLHHLFRAEHTHGWVEYHHYPSHSQCRCL
ncbi:MAG: hypothetical protein LR011_03155 [Verrucomicrobia bacterium]|nr:hypothetical protein [Verrucomicrobiota bacterium]